MIRTSLQRKFLRVMPFPREISTSTSGKSRKNPEGVSDDVWSRAFQDLGGRFDQIGNLYLVGGTLPIPGEYLAGLFDNLTVFDIESATIELGQNPELQEEGELPDEKRLAKLHGKTQKSAYLIRWIMDHPASNVSYALVDSLEKKLNVRMEEGNLGPEDLLPDTVASFRIRQINIHQVKITRTDRKGEFFLDFGYWEQMPEGPIGYSPMDAKDAAMTQLGLTPTEAKLVERREVILVPDNDPRAAHLWELWNDLDASDFEAQTYSKFVIITAQGDTKLYNHAIVPIEQVTKANEEMKRKGLRPAKYAEAPVSASREEFGGHWKPPKFIPDARPKFRETFGLVRKDQMVTYRTITPKYRRIMFNYLPAANEPKKNIAVWNKGSFPYFEHFIETKISEWSLTSGVTEVDYIITDSDDLFYSTDNQIVIPVNLARMFSEKKIETARLIYFIAHEFCHWMVENKKIVFPQPDDEKAYANKTAEELTGIMWEEALVELT